VDPVARERLQTEFLRVQAEVGTTVVLVTHDIDEAVRLGDRIAVLSEGGKLQQFAPPAELLAEPANDFVREFVGGDRGIKLLAVTPIPHERLRPGAGMDKAPVVAADATLQEALAVMLREGSNRVVVQANGTPKGVLTVEDIVAALTQPARTATDEES
jgi:osmoprotectant transport system ATP-binding protein